MVVYCAGAESLTRWVDGWVDRRYANTVEHRFTVRKLSENHGDCDVTCKCTLINKRDKWHT